MRAFTSIEQSKVLAKILPIDSADMYYEERCNLPEVRVGNYSLHLQCRATDKDYKKLTYLVLSPAWSLVALLNVLPQSTRLLKTKRGEMYHCDCPKGNIDKWFNNPIDACVEMIVKLKEKGIL